MRPREERTQDPEKPALQGRIIEIVENKATGIIDCPMPKRARK